MKTYSVRDLQSKTGEILAQAGLTGAVAISRRNRQTGKTERFVISPQNDGHAAVLYVVGFSNGWIKVGVTTGDPENGEPMRIRDHRYWAKGNKLEITGLWVGDELLSHGWALERYLINWCIKRFGHPKGGRDYFEGSYAEAAEYARELSAMPPSEVVGLDVVESELEAAMAPLVDKPQSDAITDSNTYRRSEFVGGGEVADLLREQVALLRELVDQGRSAPPVLAEPEETLYRPLEVPQGPPEPMPRPMPGEPTDEEMKLAHQYFGLRDEPGGPVLTDRGRMIAQGGLKKIARKDPESPEAIILALEDENPDREEFMRLFQIEKLVKALEKRRHGDRQWLGLATPGH